jgi:adenylate kinase family enzyme
MPKIVIFGNSGSGKSTLAARLALESGLAHLDLDTLAWDPALPTTRRRLEDSLLAMAAFTDGNDRWVVEGCYADLLHAAISRCTRLIFLNPGIEACVANCRVRPWEPHKYASPQAQDENLAMLIGWVRDYETRNDEYSLHSHRRLYDEFKGAKAEIADLSAMDGMLYSQTE